LLGAQPRKVLPAGCGVELVEGIEQHHHARLGGGAGQQRGEGSIHIVGPGLFGQGVFFLEEVGQFLDEASQHEVHLRAARGTAGGVGEDERRFFVGQPLKQFPKYSAFAGSGRAGKAGTPVRTVRGGRGGEGVQLMQQFLPPGKVAASVLGILHERGALLGLFGRRWQRGESAGFFVQLLPEMLENHLAPRFEVRHLSSGAIPAGRVVMHVRSQFGIVAQALLEGFQAVVPGSDARVGRLGIAILRGDLRGMSA
jgi:hypothetical protein